MHCYSPYGVFTPAFSTHVCYGSAAIRDYYARLIAKQNLFIKLFDVSESKLENAFVYWHSALAVCLGGYHAPETRRVEQHEGDYLLKSSSCHVASNPAANILKCTVLS